MANETQRLRELLTNRVTETRAGYLDELDFDLDGRLGAPAGESLADDIASVKGLVDTAATTGAYTYTDAGGEQTVYEDTATTVREVEVRVSNRNMTNPGTVRIYCKVDGSNYDHWRTRAMQVGEGDERAWSRRFSTTRPWKITYEEDSDEGADRDIPYEVITSARGGKE